MHTYYLKFADKNEALSELQKVNLADDEGNIRLESDNYTLDVVGTIYRTQIDPNTSDPIVVELPGYHLNFVGELPDSLTAFIVHPKKPARIFFEVETTTEV